MRKKETVPEIYRQAYIDNEADANRKMARANALGAGVAIVLWILYIHKFFTISNAIYPVVCILFPVSAVILLVPLLFLKSEKIKSPLFKHFLIGSFINVVASINVTLPKHGVLGWALAIVMACHYYNPKFARKIYIATIALMLVCLYLGMFFGEYDPLLLGLGVVENGEPTTVNRALERVEYIKTLMANGNNRYLKVFFMYYLPRAAVITLLFVIANSLNRRTKQLLQEEIKAHGEQEKVRAELGVAKDIQINTLPTEYIKDGDIEVIGGLSAAKEVGGDLYDYFYIDKDHVAVLIGDVSGKGIPAAMFMMKVITSFRDFATPDKTPSQILKDINTSVKKGNKTGMFVTCFLVIIDKRDGNIVYSNAGHNPPVVGGGKDFRYLKPDQGLLLGMFDNPPLKDEELVLSSGESITLYTDGVTEARDKKGGFFGEKRFLETFNKKEYSSVGELHNTIKEDIEAFAGNEQQSDDITMVTLRYFGSEGVRAESDEVLAESEEIRSEKEFEGKKKNVKKMLDYIGDFYEENGLPADFKNKLLIVGDEILSNVIKYGYAHKSGPITLKTTYFKEKKEFVLTVIDEAKAFNPLAVNVKNDAPRIGGYGLSIVRKTMDECSYERANDKNVLTLKKSF